MIYKFIICLLLGNKINYEKYYWYLKIGVIFMMIFTQKQVFASCTVIG